MSSLLQISPLSYFNSALSGDTISSVQRTGKEMALSYLRHELG